MLDTMRSLSNYCGEFEKSYTLSRLFSSIISFKSTFFDFYFMTIDVSFVIVSYKHDLKLLIDDIQKTVKLSYEIIISNNYGFLSLQDDAVKIINNKHNLGYGRACNKAIKISKGKYIIILNPDVTINKNTIPDLIQFMNDNKQVNIAAPKLLYPDGSLQYSCRRFPTLSTLLLRNTRLVVFKSLRNKVAKDNMLDYNHKEPRQVDWVSGAFMVLRRKYLFDSNFFMYFEDVDLCRRVGNVWYYPQAFSYHVGSHGSKKSLKLFCSHIKSMVYYFIKYYFLL